MTEQELADIRVKAMLDTVAAQRNSALNEVANLRAENAALTRAIQEKMDEVSAMRATIDALNAQLQRVDNDKE
jgi:uncharacterized coiled-coil DUF342 family protein